ncbi:MAG: UDP-N-acetylmuramate dehydrogenase [Alphaproteobacteria bacterium]|nr:UDP-N-acetylmuramate dehydrogenase [Alphaproteobacteria bacterium]
MMAGTRSAPHLIDRLPKARGRLTSDAPLAPVTWFRVGGVAEVLFRPADVEDLQAFLAALPNDIPVTVLGVASNLLVRDGGVRGVVIRLLRGFVDVTVEGTTVIAGAGALDLNVALTARDHGVAGLEFLSGVPGTIGGALRMNAGAYGGEMKDIVESAEMVGRDGARRTMSAAELGFTYRHSAAPEDAIFVGATLRGRAGDHGAIGARIVEIDQAREASQPRSRTGGSTFVNPPGARAWELIDRAGCRGLRLGGAQVSEKHCNFLINTGDATAHDIEALGEEVRRRVFEHSGVALRWEIKRIGEFASAPVTPGVPA